MPFCEGGGADADDPERAVLALFLFAAGVGELQSALDGFLGSLVELGFGEEVAGCALENFAAAIGALGTAFYTRHGAVLFAWFG